MKEQIGDRIKKIREQNDLTTISFAKSLGISQPSLTALENNKSEPRAKTIISLYENFNVDPLWLLTGKTQDKILNPEGIELAKKIDKLSPDSRQRFLETIDRELLLEEILQAQETKKAASD